MCVEWGGACMHACVLIPNWFIKSDCKFLLKVRIAEALAFSASKCITQQGILCVKTKQWDCFAVFVFFMEFMYFVFTCMPSESDVFWGLIVTSFLCVLLSSSVFFQTNHFSFCLKISVTFWYALWTLWMALQPKQGEKLVAVVVMFFALEI